MFRKVSIPIPKSSICFSMLIYIQKCLNIHVIVHVHTRMYIYVHTTYTHIRICNTYNMASKCVSAISDLNPEIVAQGEAEGCYRGVTG